MHWILEPKLFKDTEWAALLACLERFNIPHSIHKVIPFVGELLPPATPASDKVICFGSYSMRHAAKSNAWSPGVYDLEAQNFLIQLEHWGEHLLNSDARVLPFKDVTLEMPTFIRPIDDSKHFTGKVFEPEEFNAWRFGICTSGDDYGNGLSSETRLQLCEPKQIYAEYRYFIVDGKIVTKSMYKRGDRARYLAQVDSRFDAFVEEHTSLRTGWQPHRAFVFDVADTPQGLKIVEINTINSAGFYAADITAVVLALEAMEER